MISFYVLAIFVIPSTFSHYSARGSSFRSKRELGSNNIDFRWFDQILDHFDPSDVEPSWRQRYLVNDEFYSKSIGGPVFLEISGEVAMTEMLGAGLNYAEKFGALCFKLEHRFYGQSRPTSTLSTKNLRYLSSHQALADIAYFIWKMNEIYSLSDETKWIVFGGSYAGSLAAWSRLKYPHLIYAAVASSPIMSPQPEFAEYFEEVERVITNYDSACATNIRRAAQQLELLMNNSVGMEIIKEKFRLCSTVDLSEIREKSNAENEFSFIFAETVQDAEMSPTGKLPYLDYLCSIMKREKAARPLDSYAFVDILLNRKLACRNVSFRSMVNMQRNEHDFENQRQWLWQSCAEFGLFLTSSTEKSMFGSLINNQYYLDTCVHALGAHFDLGRISKATDLNRIEFGGTKYRGRRIVLVAGRLDPWQKAGFVETNDPNLVRISIAGVSHCIDMGPKKEDDLKQLKEARNQIEKILEDWLKSEEH